MTTKPLTQTYTPTFMEKLLGKNYKWWYFFVFSFKIITIFKSTIFGYSIGEVVEAYAIILLWQSSFVGKSEPEIKSIVTYFVLGYFLQTITRTYIDNSLPGTIATGKLVKMQMFPQGLFKQIIVRGMATSAATNMFSLFTVPIFIIPFFVYIQPFSSDYLSLLALVGLFFTNLFIKSFYQITISSISFWTPEYSGFVRSSDIVQRVLSGALVPFYILTTNFEFLKNLPFAYTFYHPMQIYLGKYTQAQTGWALLGGIAWCFVLYLLARFVFKVGLKRKEAVGL